MKKVSIILTTKNEQANICRCLDAVMSQTFKPLEIIVVDNASTDQTKELARLYTDKVFDKGPERSAQRNFGVEQSTGDYVLYIDADMALEPTVVAQCVDALSENPLLAGLYIPERIVGQGFWIKVRTFERSFYDGTVIDAVRFVPRQLFIAVGGFDSSLFGGEDWDFDKRIRQHGPVARISAALSHNEGAFNVAHYLAKKTYYSRSLDAYAAKWGRDDPDVKRQLGAGYRFIGVFLERGKFLRLLAHPWLTLAMYYLRFRVGLRYLARQHRI